MGSPREMVSDVLYAVVYVFARGDAARIDAMLEVWEERYADGTTGRANVAETRGGPRRGHLADQPGPVRRVAERRGIAESTLRESDRKLREMLDFLVEHRFLRPEELVRTGAAAGSDPGSLSP